MNAITKISTCEDVVLITLRNFPVDMQFISGIFSKIAQKGINVDMISQTAPIGGKIDLSFTIGEDDLGNMLDVMTTLRGQLPKLKSDICSGNCKISLYGDLMKEIPGVAANVFDVLAGAGADIRLITTSEVDISVLVPKSDFGNVIEILQKTYNV